MSTSVDRHVLLEVLRKPDAACALTIGDWNSLLPAARLSGVLPRLASRIIQGDLLQRLPSEVHWHLKSAWQQSEHSHKTLVWEIDRLGHALKSLECKLVLLKGAAYVAADLPLARGRISSDVDLLVSETSLRGVEAAARCAGWAPKDLDPRDADYFRRWLHELPPLRHKYRQVELDVHHRILPLTDRLSLDAETLIEQSVEIDGARPFRMLSPVDMVAHCAVHLFRNGDFSRALRDLCDLDDLVRIGAAAPEFWDRLTARVESLRLQRPVGLALRYSNRYLHTPCPPDVLQRFARRGLPLSQMMWDRVVERAVFPRSIERPDHGRSGAIWLLSHYPIPRAATVLSPLFWLKRLPLRAA